MLFSLCCSVVIMLYCYFVALLLFVLSYVLTVCTVPLPPGVNPLAVDKYIYLNTFQYNVNLKFLLLGNNNILDINIAFLSGINPTYLDLSQNSKRYLENSVFRKQGQLELVAKSRIMYF